MAAKDTNKSQTVEKAASGESFLGGNAKDSFTITGNDNLLDGGNGKDALAVTGTGNDLLGGNGDDKLSASYVNQYDAGAGNILDGGNGDDTFSSLGRYGFDVSGIASDISGGHGMDQFVLRQSSDTLIHNAGAGDATVMEGHVIEGVFDVIRDYQAGELIDIGTTTMQTDPVDINPTGGVDHQHLILEDGSYAFIHGDFDAATGFTVDDEGADLLIVYDYDPADEFWSEYGGSVVLVGVSDEADVNIGTLTA